MTRFFLLLRLLSKITTTSSQAKYQFEPHIGLSGIFAKSGSDDPKDIIEITPVRPATFNIGVSFNLQVNPKFYLGLRYAKTEYDYGYNASITGGNFNGLGLSFGFSSKTYSSRILTHGLGINMHYAIREREKSSVGCIGILEFQKLIKNDNFDTTWWNDGERWYHPSAPTTKYFSVPPIVDYEWHPVLNLGLKYTHRIRPIKNLNYVFESYFKIGFHTFFKDQTYIVKDFYTNPQGRLFYTNIN